MPSGDIFRLSAVGHFPGPNLAVMTMHVKLISENPTPEDACAMYKTSLLALVSGGLSSFFTWEHINYLSANLTPPIAGQYVAGFPIVGSETGQIMVYQVAMIASLKTAYAGRSYRGRMYWPGLAEDRVDNGIIAPTWLNAVQVFYNTMVAAYGEAGTDPDLQVGVYSHTKEVFTPLLSVVVKNVPATQRRRRIGVGQ